jgi:hypothetical protein
MNHKEKAKELVDKILNIDEKYGSIGFHEAKQCALVAVDFAKKNPLNTNGYNNYLDDIKKEIELL